MNYREEVIRNCPNFDKVILETKLSLAGLGVAGEAGEVADEIKKIIHHSKEMDRDKLVKEMGDVYWYLEYLGAVIGVTTEEVLATNIKKLRERYPNGFSPEAANARFKEMS